MICFEVTRNGKRLCTAGLKTGILSGDIMWGDHARDPAGWTVSLYVGGVTDQTSVEWVREELAVGDSVCFKVVDAASADASRPNPPHDPEWRQSAELSLARHQYQELGRRMRELEQAWGERLSEADA
jgi:hypothetical protein